MVNELGTPAPSGPPILEFNHVTKTFDGPAGAKVQALADIHFTIPDEEAGEFVALLGPSGSGKSTILNMISGLLHPSTGDVKVLGHSLKDATADAVTVQQAYTCFPWRTVKQNVEFGLEIEGLEPATRAARAMEYLEKVGLADRANAYPKELSGGMQQRVAIARALALQRPIVLMDEPFGALDAMTRSTMQQLLMSLWKAEKNFIFFITHDIAEAVLLADRILVLSPRPAKVIYDLRIPFNRPRHPMITTEKNFVETVQSLMQVLRSSALDSPKTA